MANSSRLIDPNAVLKHFDGYGWGTECDAEIILDYIAEGAPTVDAVEVVHGRWDKVKCFAYATLYHCQICGHAEIRTYPYCPNCGAKMDGGNEDG